MKLVKEKLNENAVSQTLMSIKDELSEFLKATVMVKSGGTVKDEREAALLLYDILKTRYKIDKIG